MKGDLSKVPNFAKRCQEFTATWMGNRSIQQVHKDILKSLNEILLVPDALTEKTEEFDPVALIMQLAEDDLSQEMIEIFKFIPKFEGSDEEFGQIMKERVTKFVTALVCELADGFDGNYADV